MEIITHLLHLQITQYARYFLYFVTVLTTFLAVTTIIPRPRWMRSPSWKERHPL